MDASQIITSSILSWMFDWRQEPCEEIKLYLGKYFADKDIEKTINSLGEIPEDIKPQVLDMLQKSVEHYRKVSKMELKDFTIEELRAEIKRRK